MMKIQIFNFFTSFKKYIVVVRKKFIIIIYFISFLTKIYTGFILKMYTDGIMVGVRTNRPVHALFGL